MNARSFFIGAAFGALALWLLGWAAIVWIG